MPRREDIKKILIIGSGPIVIGQACEFDYSGTQGAKALAAEGYEIVLVNSNPATIMTDPELANRTYVEPLEPATLRRILERERPCAVLPTLGGQTALNLALALDADGTLERLGVELLGASPKAIRKAEDRQLFKEAMAKIGLECPRSGHAHSIEEAREIVETTGYPVILRPSFTLGGSGGDIVYRPEDLDTKVAWALSQSPTREVLVEESVLGWKELEYEVVRDTSGNFIVVCTIENIDPMGVHTGDSITVAPAMTLTDKEHQRLRDASRAIMAEIGVLSGGANVQFAICPKTGRVVVIEMNPRVSRSSALASKATGYPIAKITAKLAVGYRLDELKNDITGTSAAFEPAIDYVVVKWPRFAFEKFPGADPRLGTQMKSVGEAMAIGRTLPEALQKAARSLENGRDGLVSLLGRVDYTALAETPERVRDLSMEAPPEPSVRESRPPKSPEAVRAALAKLVAIPTPDRLFYVADAMREPASMTDEELYRLTSIDPWFLAQLRRIIQAESKLRPTPESIREAKRLGFSDAQIAEKVGWSVEQVREVREANGIVPMYLRVDTCAGELATDTAYFYSSYETKDEAEPSERRKIVILGGGPNRIGQGIEFDYCCVHAAFALRDLGFETVMVNCNPETVSTDFDTSDRLYFEPLTFESALSICQREASKGTLEGVIVQFGGQTPLKLAVPLANAGIKLLGTSADAIDRAEDRERFDALLSKLGLKRPRGGIARGVSDAFRVAKEIGYPVLVRPSYVLGGRAMMICHSDEDLAAYVALAVEAAREAGTQTILVDEFLKDAIEVDVDSLSDGQEVVIGGVMQHIEEAGVHSGDSSSVLPPHSLPPEIVASIEEQTRQLALELGVVGLMNIQFAVKDGVVYVLEVNPRASRTVPFVSKATGRPLAKLAAKVMAGKTLRELGLSDPHVPRHVAVKESVFPFAKFPGVDTVLGPEMRSTGEVMGMAPTFGRAFGKSLIASGVDLSKRGRAFISVKDEDKPAACAIARRLRALGFTIVATAGTAKALERAHVPAEIIKKVGEGSPHVVDAIRARTMTLVVNTTIGAKEIRDSYAIRRQTLLANIPYFTTMAAAMAAVEALEAGSFEPDSPAAAEVRSLQEWHGEG